MRPLAVLVLLALAGCGGGGDDGRDEAAPVGSTGTGPANGLTLAVSFDEPLRSGEAVTFTLEVHNRGAEAVTLRFPSGKDGDVALQRDGREAYRWSSTRYFTQAMRHVRLEAGERRTFDLPEPGFAVEAGDYELEASLDSEPAPAPVRRPVTVE